MDTLHNGHAPILLFYPILFIIGMIVHSFIPIHSFVHSFKSTYRIVWDYIELHSTALYCTLLYNTHIILLCANPTSSEPCPPSYSPSSPFSTSSYPHDDSPKTSSCISS
eukprot:34880_1